MQLLEIRKIQFMMGMSIVSMLIGCGMHEEKLGGTHSQTQVGGQSGGTPSTSSSPASPSTSPINTSTFQWIRANVIEPQCVRCHSSSGSASDIPFTSFAEVKASGTISNTASTSSFYNMVANAKMPPRQPRLADSLVLAIEGWINSGALNN